MPGLRSSITTIGSETAALSPGLDEVANDREMHREQMYERFVTIWDALRVEHFFESLLGKLHAHLFKEGIAVPGMRTRRPLSKLVLISDIHGNIDALDAVMDEVRKEGNVGFLNLGDMVGYGAYPRRWCRSCDRGPMLGVAGNF